MLPGPSQTGRWLAIVAFAALLGTALPLAAYGQALDELFVSRAVVAVPHIEPPPPSGPVPAPVPAFSELPRLRVERSDGTALVDVVPFDERGNPIPEAFDAITAGFAPQSGERQAIDPNLVELLVLLSRAFDGKPIVLISGHRDPGLGTRKSSYHVKGMAADIAIRGVKARELRTAAWRLGAWGVGLYPSYVHVDVRRTYRYRWAGWGWRRRR